MHESTIKVRLYPNQQQTEFIHQQLGCCRFVWNQLLAKVNSDYEDYQNGLRNKPVISRRILEANLLLLKTEYPFLREVSSVPLQQVVIDLYRALTDFFNKLRGYPRFKSKSNRGSFRIVNLNMIKFTENKLYLPKNQTPIKTRGNHQGVFPISSYRIVKEPDGKLYSCFVTKVNSEPKVRKGTIGIDLGLTHLLTVVEYQGKQKTSTTFIKNNRYYVKAQKRLKRLQQSLSRKQKGSQNRTKARVKVAKAHKKITAQRNDCYHKLTTDIAKRAKVVCLEDLNIKGLMKNSRLAKHIQDASWGKLVSMITYKVERRGGALGFVSRFFPSTQRCSACLKQSKTKIALGVHTWTCNHCHTAHERDENAALNVRLEGMRNLALATVG